MADTQSSNTANLFVDWGAFHKPHWQACDFIPIVPGQTTVLDLMQKAGTSCNPSIVFTYKESGQSAFLTSIDGVENNANGNGYWWIFYVNGKLAQVGFGAYVLNDSDSVVWDYKHYRSGLRQATLPDSELPAQYLRTTPAS